MQQESGCRAKQIDEQQASPGFEDAADFRQRLPLERGGQVVEDEATDDDIESLIGEGQLLHRLDPQINGQAAAPGLLASAGHHLGGGIDASDQPA